MRTKKTIRRSNYRGCAEKREPGKKQENRSDPVRKQPELREPQRRQPEQKEPVRKPAERRDPGRKPPEQREPGRRQTERREPGRKPPERRQAGKRQAILRKRRRKRMIRRGIIAAAAVLLICLIIVFIPKGKSSKKKEEPVSAQAVSAVEEQPAVVEEKDKEIDFLPACTENTAPSKLISYTEVEVDGNVLSNLSEYKPEAEIQFGVGKDYTDVDGIVTFRGNNFRNSPAYGFVDLKENAFQKIWTKDTGSLSYGDAVWTGSGWTGQPLMVKWPSSTKNVMNMQDWAKQKSDLVEVIYACMDGYVYFLDLDSGKATRDPLYLGYTFKGSGALDPRGYPILYVGAGYNSEEGTARVFVVNLLDCSVMYTFGNEDEFSLRGTLSFFDSSPLVDEETDTLIYPGENGILYLIKLNTQYDEKNGTLSINPNHVVKWHYYGTRSSTESYWLGMEDSAAVYKGYLFVADNGGNLMCLDLNTLQLVWVQDILDDSNSTPVLSIEDDHLYLYVSTSFRLGWRSYDTAEVPVWKIDAQNGEIVWKTSYECYTEDGVSGGVQSTIASGKFDLCDYIYVTVARTGEAYNGVLACLDKKTGKTVWDHKAYYSWSSPVCVYNKEGNGKVLYCSCGGKLYLLDGLTGEVHDTFDFGDTAVEASPAVYDNHLVIGTRDCKIYGIDLV